MNALSAFLITSLFFVIGTMVEFAVVLLIKRLDDLNTEKTPKGPLFMSESKVEGEKRKTLEKEITPQTKKFSLTDKIDFISLILFMATYLLFSCIYFAHYM